MGHPQGNVAVFWDLRSCRIPVLKNQDSTLVMARGIRRVVERYGPIVHMQAYSNEEVRRTLTERDLSTLQNSGFELSHDIEGDKIKDTRFPVIVDIIFHLADYRRTKTLVLITGDSSFAHLVSALRSRKVRVVAIVTEDVMQDASFSNAFKQYIWPKNVQNAGLLPEAAFTGTKDVFVMRTVAPKKKRTNTSVIYLDADSSDHIINLVTDSEDDDRPSKNKQINRSTDTNSNHHNTQINEPSRSATNILIASSDPDSEKEGAEQEQEQDEEITRATRATRTPAPTTDEGNRESGSGESYSEDSDSGKEEQAKSEGSDSSDPEASETNSKDSGARTQQIVGTESKAQSKHSGGNTGSDSSSNSDSDSDSVADITPGNRISKQQRRDAREGEDESTSDDEESSSSNEDEDEDSSLDNSEDSSSESSSSDEEDQKQATMPSKKVTVQPVRTGARGSSSSSSSGSSSGSSSESDSDAPAPPKRRKLSPVVITRG